MFIRLFKSLMAEFMGTLVLVLVGCGSCTGKHIFFSFDALMARRCANDKNFDKMAIILRRAKFFCQALGETVVLIIGCALWIEIAYSICASQKETYCIGRGPSYFDVVLIAPPPSSASWHRHPCTFYTKRGKNYRGYRTLAIIAVYSEGGWQKGVWRRTKRHQICLGLLQSQQCNIRVGWWKTHTLS